MKKILLFFWFVLGFSALSAQDTITMFDSFYMYRPIIINDSEIFCEDKEFYGPHNIDGNMLANVSMHIVPSPTTIYGLAVVPASVGSLSMNWDSVHPDVDLVAVVYAKEGPGYFVLVDSVSCRISTNHANILYQDLTSGSHLCWTKDVREFYFDYPCVVSDTCFIGIRCDRFHNNFSGENDLPYVGVIGLSGGVSTMGSWLYYNGLRVLSKNASIFPICDAFTLKPYNEWQNLDSCDYYMGGGYAGWGGTFPIIGFHCKTAPEGFRTVGTGGGYCDLAWNSLSGGTYEVAVGHWGESPDTVSRRYLTTDTTIRIDSLEPGTLYQAWVRGQCRYATVSYDTSLWSPWSIRMPIMLTNGIQQAEGPHFTLTPNPASGTVTVGGFEGEGSVEIVDMAGRVSGQWPVDGGQRTIDISRLPAGSYVVRLTTAEGTASRMLQVE